MQPNAAVIMRSYNSHAVNVTAYIQQMSARDITRVCDHEDVVHKTAFGYDDELVQQPCSSATARNQYVNVR